MANTSNIKKKKKSFVLVQSCDKEFFTYSIETLSMLGVYSFNTLGLNNNKLYLYYNIYCGDMQVRYMQE